METEMQRQPEGFSVCMNDPTNLEAVLVGLQNGVDLRRGEDVAAEHCGCPVASGVLVALPHTGRPS